jgi:general secretion pathway protein G
MILLRNLTIIIQKFSQGKNRMHTSHTRSGFTLIEIMIVIIILGFLAALVMPNLMGQSEKAKKKIACIQMKTIQNSLKEFKLQYGTYPTAKEGLQALIKNPDPKKYPDYPRGGFLDSKTVPKDPWGGRYIYLNNGEEIDIVSLGADKKEGGKGESADIYLSQCQQ